MLLNMERNQILGALLSLTDFTKDVPSFIQLLKDKGYSPITPNQIRSWRRVGGNRAPDFVFEVLFDYLFERKNQKKEFCSVFSTEQLEQIRISRLKTSNKINNIVK